MQQWPRARRAPPCLVRSAALPVQPRNPIGARSPEPGKRIRSVFCSTIRETLGDPLHACRWSILSSRDRSTLGRADAHAPTVWKLRRRLARASPAARRPARVTQLETLVRGNRGRPDPKRTDTGRPRSPHRGTAQRGRAVRAHHQASRAGWARAFRALRTRIRRAEIAVRSGHADGDRHRGRSAFTRALSLRVRERVTHGALRAIRALFASVVAEATIRLTQARARIPHAAERAALSVPTAVTRREARRVHLAGPHHGTLRRQRILARRPRCTWQPELWRGSTRSTAGTRRAARASPGPTAPSFPSFFDPAAPPSAGLRRCSPPLSNRFDARVGQTAGVGGT